MKTNSFLKSDRPIQTYLNLMKDIEFMQQFTEDPDIFNSESGKLNNFLIQSFCYLHPDFHYLSFLNNEDIDMEILKAAGILQILPTNSMSKRYKLFDDMSENDIHKFWLNFFGLFKKQGDFTTDSIFNINWLNKMDYFKDINSTLKYLNYRLPIINENKFNDIIVSKELNDWKAFKDDFVITYDESVDLNFDQNQVTEVDINNLITDLQQVVTMFSNKKLVCQESKPNNIDFFTTFINLTKNILHYKNDLTIINSKFLSDYNFELFANNENISENLYFIKRCNNLVKTLKSEMKTLKYF